MELNTQLIALSRRNTNVHSLMLSLDEKRQVTLAAREWAILELLLARPGMVLSRRQLEDKLYSWKDEVSSNAVEVYIHGLRKKLGAGLIQNVRGVGYMIPKALP